MKRKGFKKLLGIKKSGGYGFSKEKKNRRFKLIVFHFMNKYKKALGF